MEYLEILDDNGKYILPAGTIIRYDTARMIGEVIEEADVPASYTEEEVNRLQELMLSNFQQLIDDCPQIEFNEN